MDSKSIFVGCTAENTRCKDGHLKNRILLIASIFAGGILMYVFSRGTIRMPVIAVLVLIPIMVILGGGVLNVSWISALMGKGTDQVLEIVCRNAHRERTWMWDLPPMSIPHPKRIPTLAAKGSTRFT